MIAPLITGFYTAILALIYLVLTYHVIVGRWKYKIGINDGGNPDMATRIRVHGNFAEFVPFTLLIMLLLELNGLSNLYLHIFGATLILARLAHAYGLNKTQGFSPQRFAGNILTHLLLLIGSAGAICFYVF